jgi:hypothetical protein
VEIRDGGNFTLRLANIYIPPRDINADQDEIRKNKCIQELLTADTILAGEDINFKKAKWDCYNEYIGSMLIADDGRPYNIGEAAKKIELAIRKASKKFIPQGNVKLKINPLLEYIKEQI